MYSNTPSTYHGIFRIYSWGLKRNIQGLIRPYDTEPFINIEYSTDVLLRK